MGYGQGELTSYVPGCSNISGESPGQGCWLAVGVAGTLVENRLSDTSALVSDSG